MNTPRSLQTAALFGILTAGLMIAQQLAGKAIRDAYFLAHFEPSFLPTVVMIASVISLGTVFGTTHIYRRWAPNRILPSIFLASASWYVAEWYLSGENPRLVAISVYIHTTSFGAVLVSGFWSTINERFDPHHARVIVNRIAGGATAGGMLGGFAAWQGAALAGPKEMILVLASAHLFCALGAYLLRPSSQAKQKSNRSDSPPSVATIMEETPYLWHIAVLVAISALGAAAFDYVFKDRAAATLTSSQDLVEFFALFYLSLGVLTFFFQNLFSARVINKLGISASVASMPLTTILLGTTAIVWDSLWSAILLRGGIAILESSLYRSGYELLYTPLTPVKKRSTKALIDVGGDKLGAATGSALAMVIIASVPLLANQILLILAIICGILALFITRMLHRGYIRSLEENLQTGSSAEVYRSHHRTIPSHQATELRILEPTPTYTINIAQGITHQLPISDPTFFVGLNHPDITRQKFNPRTSSSQHFVPPIPKITGLHSDLLPSDIDTYLSAVAALRSGEPARIMGALYYYQPLPPSLTPLVVPLLSWAELRPLVVQSLQQVVIPQSGLLTDFMTSARINIEVRRHLPAIFTKLHTPSSVHALTLLLQADAFELRLRAAKALRNLVEDSSHLVVQETDILSAIHRALTEVRLAYPTLSVGCEPLAGRALVFSFALLACILPPKPLRTALTALSTTSENRRGTGREYLENILHPGIKDEIMDFLSIPSIALKATDSESQVLIELSQPPSHSPPRLSMLTPIPPSNDL
ncbi:MAG: hypothetical protein KTR25_18840 [Myxococcales bacterium]|nr:hypothetical protein [Myxococcales bacterium]